jgi:hypothetical protein
LFSQTPQQQINETSLNPFFHYSFDVRRTSNVRRNFHGTLIDWLMIDWAEKLFTAFKFRQIRSDRKWRGWFAHPHRRSSCLSSTRTGYVSLADRTLRENNFSEIGVIKEFASEGGFRAPTGLTFAVLGVRKQTGHHPKSGVRFVCDMLPESFQVV